jgi:hypothetical protein
MSNEQTHHEGGFWGGITLVSILWTVLTFAVFFICFSLIYFLVVFTVYAIWYYCEEFAGCPKQLLQSYNPETGKLHEIMVDRNPADIISVFNFFAGVIYSVIGLFLLWLFLKALTM